jgi:hypothetical protein
MKHSISKEEPFTQRFKRKLNRLFHRKVYDELVVPLRSVTWEQLDTPLYQQLANQLDGQLLVHLKEHKEI